MPEIGHRTWDRKQVSPEPLGFEQPWREGYELARRTRALFGVGAADPIGSLRSLLDEQFGIPLLTIEMNRQVAGATMANGPDRGIVVNAEGLNKNVWVRRMTVAHELCHFLWDVDESLDLLKVDSYDDLKGDDRSSSRNDIEKRANAFAVEFLAPQTSILRVAMKKPTRRAALIAISQEFGISITAAGYHLDNSNHAISALYGDVRVNITPDESWRAAEDFSLDFFPMPSVPPSRRGRFAQLVARGRRQGYLTEDSAAVMLKAPLHEFITGYQSLLGMSIDGKVVSSAVTRDRSI